MSDSNPFFIWVYRLLAISALLLVVAVAAMVGWSMYASSDWRQRQTVELPVAENDASAGARQRLRFYNLETLPGTGVQAVQVGQVTKAGKSFGSSSYRGNELRNVVFFSPGEGEARWLFADNTRAIETFDKLCDCSGSEAKTVLALYVESRLADADSDAEQEQAVVPALVRPDGSGYQALYDTPVRVLGHELDAENRSMGLLVEESGRLVHRVYALEPFRQISEREITRLPGR